MEPSLKGERLHLWRGERHVLRGVDLQLSAGEALQVRGVNGSGKTSLLRTLCGLAQPEEGRVLWQGTDVRRDLPAYHSALGYLGHDSPLKGDLTSGENLRYWAGVRRSLTPADVDAALEKVGGGEWRERSVRTLSAGQRRRVALAGLTLLGATLWVLDEPTTNLDAEGQGIVAQMIAAHLRGGGLAVVAIHHDLSLPPSTHLRRLDLH